MLPHFHHSPAFARKLKSSFCCFHGFQQDDFLDSPSKSPTRSPCSWFKSTVGEFRGILARCRYLLARIARRRKRYLASVDFSYDSSSYALNFEDDCREDDEFPFRNFTARFPPPIKERVPAAKFAGSEDGISVE
ncbi:hypothetical protein SDJN02_07834, partial [Cucurbita argyrosperma subsp. argyrosperma]|uniref:Uncharacterized protein LOC111462741 n=2 Tax=Cucurbita TaxID=3660 RepID=A0A6J1HE78_CUCMO